MPKYDPRYGKQCEYRLVDVSKTTATNNVSTPSDGVVNKDYLERVIVISASTNAPGAVTVLDGDTALVSHLAQKAAYIGTNIITYEIGLLAQTTKGFNIATGTSVTALAIGRFH